MNVLPSPSSPPPPPLPQEDLSLLKETNNPEEKIQKNKKAKKTKEPKEPKEPKKAKTRERKKKYVEEKEEYEENTTDGVESQPNPPVKKPRKKREKVESTSLPASVSASYSCLKKHWTEDPNVLEIGVDEAGRGPLFGRVYSAAVILPKHSETFDYHCLKDSKKFHSKKKIEEVAEYIRKNVVSWSVQYEDEKTIDQINILQATQQAMHRAIQDVIKKTTTHHHPHHQSSYQLLIDGNYFNPISNFCKKTQKLEFLPHVCVEGGDNHYCAIAAASILAKVERDRYMEELCNQYPELKERYALDTNMGYGAKKHLEGIKQHGITPWHRKTFGICKQFAGSATVIDTDDEEEHEP